MRALSLIAVLVASSTLLAACGEEDDCCALPPKEISYEVRGTYPPFSQRLEIGEDGRAVLVAKEVDEPRRTIDFAVDPEQLESIRQELDEVDFEALPGPGGEGECFDCPTIRLGYGSDVFEGLRQEIPAELISATEQLEAIVDSAPAQDPQ